MSVDVHGLYRNQYTANAAARRKGSAIRTARRRRVLRE